MKRLLFQLSSIICCVILLASCEQEDIIIDNIQYINSPSTCLKNHNVSWNGEYATLESNSYFSFKAKVDGELCFYYNTGGWSALKIKKNTQSIFNDAFYYSSNPDRMEFAKINFIKKGDLVTFRHDDSNDGRSSYVTIYGITLCGTLDTDNSGFDF